MRGFFKGMLSMALITALAGGVLLIAGLVMGGKPNGVNLYWDNGLRMRTTEFGSTLIDFDDNTHQKEKPTKPTKPSANAQAGAGRADAEVVNQSEIRNLDIEIGGATVTIIEGDGFALTVTGTQAYTQEFVDGTWEISNASHGGKLGLNSMQEVYFDITVPSNHAFDEISLSIGAGMLTGSDLACRKLEVDVGAGSADLTNITATVESDWSVGAGALNLQGTLNGEVDFECGMGRIIANLARPEDFGYIISSGMGSVSVDGDTYSGTSVDTSRNPKAATVYEIDCGMGSVEIQFPIYAN